MSSTSDTSKALKDERTDLLETLAQHRGFLRFTVRGLTDEQAAQRTTVSALCLGGLIKHVAVVESAWTAFIAGGAAGMAAQTSAGSRDDEFRMLPGETLSGILQQYDEVARHTEELVATLPDLGASHPLPEAPWFEQGASWSARSVLLHILAETAQHAGHADILREAIDGAKTMG